jgi:peroxiredoxin/YHS domain-containing protein
MRTWFVAMLMAASFGSVGTIATAAEKAVCLVCSVKEGAREPESVKASRTYAGTRYDFCSEACAREFDADPTAFVQSLPRPAPDLEVADLQGAALSWDSFRDKVVLLDFWATWCAPCRKAMPEMQALHDKYAARGFTVLGVSIDTGGPAKVQKFVTSKKFTYPMALDTDQTPTWERFQVKAIPAAFLVDRDGRIVAQWTGIPAESRELEAKIEALLAAHQD